MAEDALPLDESLFVDSPPPAQDDSLFLDSPPGDDALFIDSPAADSPAPPKPEDDPWDLTRGFKVAMQQIPQLGYGVAGLIGDTTGIDSLRDWGLDGYKEASEKQMPLQRENDDVTKAWEKAKTGDLGALVDWAQYGLGYALGQAAESASVAVIGAAAGAAAGAPAGGVGAVPGAAGGAVTGVVAKQGVKIAAKNLVEKFVSKQALKLAAEKLGKKATAAEIATLASDVVVRKSAAKRLGAMVAVGGNALGMELGSIYPEAIAQAKAEGRDFTGADLAKVWGTGIAAGALEGVTDMLGLDLVTGKLRKMLPSSRTAAATIAGLAGIAAEGTTEFAQTGLERLGAGKDLTGSEATNEYLNAAALGALGGGAIGGGGAFVDKTLELRKSGLNATSDALLEAMDFAASQTNSALPVISQEGALDLADTERSDLRALSTMDETATTRLAALDSLWGEDGSFDATKAAGLFNARLDTSTPEISASAPQAATEAVEAKPHVFSVGAATITARDSSPQAMLEAAFGPAPKGREYRDDFDPAKLAADKDGKLSYGGLKLDRQLAPDGTIVKTVRDKADTRAPAVTNFLKPLKKEASSSTQQQAPASIEKPAVPTEVEPVPAAAQAPQASPAGSGVAASLSPQASSAVEPVVTASPDAITPTPNTDANAQDAERQNDEGGATRVAQKAEGQKGQQADEGQVLIPQEGGTSPGVPSPAPVVASTKTVGRTRQDVDIEIEEFIRQAEEDGLKPTAESYRRKLTRLREERESLPLDPNLASPSPESAPVETARSEASVRDVEMIRSVAPDNTVTGDDTPLGKLEVGMPVVARHPSGKAMHTRVVLSTGTNEKGQRVHTLSRPVNNDEVIGEPIYASARIAPSVRETTAARSVADALLLGTGPALDTATITRTTALLKSVLSRIAGQPFADAMFKVSSDPLLGHTDGNSIEVNPTQWAHLLGDRLRGLSATSREADAIIEDWISEMEATLWHETRHKFLIDSLKQQPEVVMVAMESLVANAAGNPQAAAMLGQVARGRYQYQKFHDAKLAGITDAQVLELLAGESVNGVVLSPQELREETFALGAEFDALFIQHLHSGIDPAAIRAAADRFMSDVIGDPTKSSTGTITIMLERLAELLRRGIEAAARFMRAHRLANTLPQDFLQLSLDLDQVMKGKGIVTPDPTRVVERFSRQASQRMADVAAVEERLKSREWFDGDKRVTEFDVKQGVRDLVRLATEKDPEVRPVVLDRRSGKLRVGAGLEEALSPGQIKLLNDLLDRLNDPRRSATALEATQIAKDMRLVLRNLNYGIPTTSKASVDPTWDEDIAFSRDFERAAAVLNENFTTELEARTGFTVASVLDAINQSLLTLQPPTPPSSIREVRAVMAAAGHAPYDALEARAAKLDAEAAALEARVPAADPKEKQKLLAQAGRKREQMLALRYQQELLVNHLEGYTPPDKVEPLDYAKVQTATVLRDNIRRARIVQAAAETSHAEALALFHGRSSSLRDFGDLASAAYTQGQLATLLSGLPSLDTQQLHALLSRANEVRRAFGRLGLLPDELEFMLLGGPKPASMQMARRDAAWAPVGNLILDIDAARQLLPTNAAGVLWRSRGEGGLDLGDAVPASMKIGGTSFSSGGDLEESSLESQAKAIDAATGASARVMGYEISEKKQLSPEEESSRQFSYRRNMTDIARNLTRIMRRAMILGDAKVTSDALRRGGFPELLSVDEATGEVSGMMEQTLLPIAPLLPTDDFAASMDALFDGGITVDLILSSAQFMDRMDGKGVYSPGLHHHSDGFTPAGLAHSIITPRFLRLLALTKGTEYQARMRASIKNPAALAAFDSVYASLAPGLENTRVMKGYREAAEINRVVHTLREGMIMGDVLYRESIHEASSLTRRGYDPEKIGVADESRAPLDEEFLNDARFNQSQIAREAQSKRLLGKASVQSEIAISLLRPVASTESLRLLDQLENEQKQIVLVRGAITEGSYSESDMRMMLEGSDQRENTDLEPKSDQMANTTKEWLMDQLKRHGERVMQREERVITQLMLSLYGGSEEAVRRVLNSDAFTYLAKEGDNLPVKHWDRTAIRNFLRDQLEELRQDEMARGVIRSEGEGGVRNMSFDHILIGTEERRGLIDSHPEHAAMLRQVLLTGGTLYTGTSPAAFASEALSVDEDGKLNARYDADGTSILYALFGKIGNVTILSGRADQSLKYGDEDTRVPSLSFIADSKHPMLVLPYGKMEPTTEELTLAVEAVLGWMGEHGGVDFSAIIKPLVDQFGTLNESGLFSLRAGYHQALSNHLDILDVPESQREERIAMWTNGAVKRVKELLADPLGGLSDILNPDVVAATKEDAYPKILARLLTSPAAKELLIYTTFDQNAPMPSAEALSTFGDLVGFHSVRGLDRMALQDQILIHAENGLVITDNYEQSAERMVKREEQGGFGLAGEALSTLDEVGAVISDDADWSMPPIVPLQAEWANAMLYEMLRATTPSRDASVPMEGQRRAAGLTAYQARQLLSVFDPSELNGGHPMTVEDIVNSTGDLAKALQERFSRGWANSGVVPGSRNDEAVARDQVARYGTYSMLDPLTGKARKWEHNRIQKGALLFAELAGIKFETNPANPGSRVAVEVPHLAELEAALKDRGVLKDMLTTLDAAGRPLAGEPEKVSVFEGMRRAVFGDAAADRAFVKDQSKRAMDTLNSHNNLLEALEATQQLIDDQYESLDAMLSWLDEDTAPSRVAAATIRSFIASREQVASDLARDMVGRFENFNVGSALADPFSPSAGAIVNSDNPVVSGFAGVGRRYQNWSLGMEEGVSEGGRLTEASLIPGGRYASHNMRASSLLRELAELSPDNFSKDDIQNYLARSGMSSASAEYRIANLTGLINDLSDPAALRSRIQRRALRRVVVSSPMSVASEIRSASGDITETRDTLSLSSSAQTAVLDTLYENGFKPGEAMTKARREELSNIIVPILFRELYGRGDMLDEVKGSVRAQLEELKASASDGKIQHAADVLKVLMAAGYNDRANELFPSQRQEFAGNANPLIRHRALAEMLRGELRQLASQAEEDIRWDIEKLERGKAKPVKFAGWRVDGYASLILKTGEGANAVDVEIAKRVFDAYGLMWSRLYMRNYGKSDFAVGISMTEQAALAADRAAEEGFGALGGIAPGQRFRVVDGILEPENALERIAGVLRMRGTKDAAGKRSEFPLTPEIVLARLRRDARIALGLKENDPWPIESLMPTGGGLAKGPVVTLEGSEESLESMIARIRLGDYSKKEVKSFIDQALASTKEQIAGIQKQLPSPKEYQAFLASTTSRGAQDKLDAITVKRAEVKALQRRIRTLNQRMAEYEAGKLVEKEDPAISLFSPVGAPTPSAATNAYESFADAIMARFSQASIRNKVAAYGAVATHPQKAVFHGFDPDAVTRGQLRFWLVQSQELLASGGLQGLDDGNGGDLHQFLSDALQGIAADPNNPEAQRVFHQAQTRGIAAAFARKATETWATGYLHTKAHVEESWFYRAMLHESAKVAGIFANSLEAQGSANSVRAILDKGSDGIGGKDRYKLGSEQTRVKVASFLEGIDKKSRYKVAARGMLLAQVASHLTAHGQDVGAAKGLLAVLEAAESGMARANLHSSGGSSKGIVRKGRQLWNWMHGKGFHQIDNQRVMSDMLGDVIPLLEDAIEADSASEVAMVVDRLKKLWGSEALSYADLLMGLYNEHRKGLENVLAMRGENLSAYANKPLVPFVWSNVSRESYTSSDVKSMSDMLDPAQAAWTHSPFRSWEDDSQFDLLDFDGITAPLRVMDDMLYRTMVAPAYDAVAAIVGDVSVSSDHFSQYATDEGGKPKSGYIVERAQHLHGLKLFSHHDFMKARSGALAMANMVRDEIMNDMLGFSASSRVIELYRKIAITGLARKLFSFSQPLAQSLSPVAGYLATNKARGLRFAPVLGQYLSGIAPGMRDSEAANLVASINGFVNANAPAVAHRAADSNQMLQEVMEDSRLSGDDVYRGELLGRADGAVRPVMKATGKVVDLMAKGSAKSLEYLIAKPEGWIIKPMLAHETLEELNQGRAVKVTLAEMLADPIKAGVRPRHIQAATVRVEQLFGTADRSQKGKLSQPAKTLHDDILRSLLTTLAGHPISMAANSWAASRMLRNSPSSPEFKEGLRILGMTIGQNMTFVFITAPTLTYITSVILGSLFDWDEDERREVEGSWYGIDTQEDPAERRKKLAYWAMALLGRNEDPYGYAWHQNEFTDEQQAKHDGYRYARIVKELVNQAPVIGSLSSTTLGGSLIDAGLKAADISPQSSVKQAGVILPEKWGFTGTAAEPDEDTPFSERSIYLATKLWFNYLNDSNSAAFAVDPLFQSLKYAANNSEDLDAVDALMIGATLLAPKPREIDRAIQRQYPALNDDFEALAPWEP